MKNNIILFLFLSSSLFVRCADQKSKTESQAYKNLTVAGQCLADALPFSFDVVKIVQGYLVGWSKDRALSLTYPDRSEPPKSLIQLENGDFVYAINNQIFFYSNSFNGIYNHIQTDSFVDSLCLHKNGSIISGHKDGSVCIWKNPNFNIPWQRDLLIKKIMPEPESCGGNALCLLNNGNILSCELYSNGFAGARELTLDGNLVNHITSLGHNLFSIIQLSSGGYVLGHGVGTICITDESFVNIVPPIKTKSFVNSLIEIPEFGVFVSGHQDGFIRIWTLSGKIVQEFNISLSVIWLTKLQNGDFTSIDNVGNVLIWKM